MPRSVSMIAFGVLGFWSLPLMTTPPPASMSVSPSPADVMDPPTSSVATASPLPSKPSSALPVMNVWMSPVTKTTSLMPRC